MDSDFDLVMVAERFEESLVLLSHLLCWSYEDLISLNVNSRIKKVKKLFVIYIEQKLFGFLHIANEISLNNYNYLNWWIVIRQIEFKIK